MTSRLLFGILLTYGMLFCSPVSGVAAIECYQCHGTANDYRPLDALTPPFRNPSSGGFKGNHRTHLNAPASHTACTACHPGSGTYLSSHRDGLIKVSSRINSSPLVTPYNNSTSAFLQTTNPALGKCSNVNCHFESDSPTWGDPSLVAPGQCNSCHGTPPSGTASPPGGGAAGSHAVHNAYYPGVANCIKCHADHTIESKPFAHATSIGKRGIIIRLRDPHNNTYGSFSSGTNDYLPSQVATHTYGTCKNTYCHSTVQADGGTGQPAYGAPTWGVALPYCNTTCHAVGGSIGSHDNTPTIATGSHTRHLAYYFGHSSPDPRGNCTTCHHWPSVSTIISSCYGCHTPPHYPANAPDYNVERIAKHVNGLIEVAFNPTFTNGSYKDGTSIPRSGYSTCANTYCHSDGTSLAGSVPANTSPVWGSGTMPCNGCHGNPPSYASGSPKSNSHAKHAALGVGCNTCHAGTTADGTTIANTALHVNRSYDLSPGAGVSFSYVFAVTGGTCSNISCHNNGNATWGTTLTCGDCHSTSPGGD